jgi:hypothetical protein
VGVPLSDLPNPGMKTLLPNTQVRTRESQTLLDLVVRNLSAQPATARFEWFFIAQEVLGGTK